MSHSLGHIGPSSTGAIFEREQMEVTGDIEGGDSSCENFLADTWIH